jgi:LytS/YehU family sensor histidine kinase
MNRKRLIRNIFRSSWFLSAIPVLFVVLPLLFFYGYGRFSISVYLLIIAVSYLFFLAFIAVIKRFGQPEITDKRNLDQDLKIIQLQGIKAHIDPHFIFNILNSIASLIYLDDRKSAYDYLIKFTQLLRTIFSDSESLYCTLWEELEFVSNYLDLEKLRFGDKFSYEIVTGEGINQQELVPRLVVHTFAENALNQGIINLAEGGLIKITIRKEKDYLKVVIEDNGKRRSSNTPHGKRAEERIEFTGKLYDMLNRKNDKPIKHSYSEIVTSAGDHSGSRVEIWIPEGIRV